MSTNNHFPEVAGLLVCAFAALIFQTVSSRKTAANGPKAISPAMHGAGNHAVTSRRERMQVTEEYGKLPMSFEANRGQTDARVKFLSRGNGYDLFLASTQAVLALRAPVAKPQIDSQGLARNPRAESPALSGRGNPSDILRIRFVGANAAARLSGFDELPGKNNYFIGNDPKKWRVGIPTYARVKYRDVYPGIDLVFYGDRRQLEHDFIVAPGADPAAISLAFDGATELEINGQGNLLLHFSSGEVCLHKPQIYQEGAGRPRDRETVAGNYVDKGHGRIGFEVAQYDVARPLIIDPVLSYSTYLGGSSDDFGNAIAFDSASGGVYVAGETASTNFPTTSLAKQPIFGNGAEDVFVTKLNPAGTALVYSTFLGGSGDDRGFGVGVDLAGNAYLTGDTGSPNFPVSATPFQATLSASGMNAFLSKLDPTGANLLYSTYLGGNGLDHGFAVAVDSTGKAYITGKTSSTNFTIVGGFQPSFGGSNDAFVAKFDTTATTGPTSLLYFTYLGGSGDDEGNGIAVDSTGHAYVVGDTNSFSSSSTTGFPTTASAFQKTFQGGTDAFVTKIDTVTPGAMPVYSTYLGGPTTDVGLAIALDSASPPNTYVTGKTDSSPFPTQGPFQAAPKGTIQGFVTKLKSDGTALVYSTYLGGTTGQGGADFGFGIAVDSAGSAYVTGRTTSPDFPLFRPFQAAYGGGTNDAFVTKLDPTGSLLAFSSYLGGSVSDLGFAIALDSANPPNIYVTGKTNSTDFPKTTGAFQTASQGGFDAFVTKISDSGPDFGITAADGTLNQSQSVARGVTATYNLQVEAFNGFNAMTNITCTGAPALTNCMPPASAVAPRGVHIDHHYNTSQRGSALVAEFPPASGCEPMGARSHSTGHARSHSHFHCSAPMETTMRSACAPSGDLLAIQRASWV